MGWCTSKHFKGHAECPWGAVMRGSSTQRQIWWPRFLWTRSFSHFVCARYFRSPALCLLCFSCFLSHSFFFFSPSRSLISFHLLPSLPSDFLSLIPSLFQLSWDLRFFLACAPGYHTGCCLSSSVIYPLNISAVCFCPRVPEWWRWPIRGISHHVSGSCGAFLPSLNCSTPVKPTPDISPLSQLSVSSQWHPCPPTLPHLPTLGLLPQFVWGERVLACHTLILSAV